MSGFDLAVVCALGAAAALGYRLGVRTHLAAWLGVGAGLAFGVAVAWAATRGRTGWNAALVGALGLLVPTVLGLLTGRAVQRRPIYVQPEPLDRIHGAIAGGLLATLVVFVAVPPAGATPGSMGERISASTTFDLIEGLPGPMAPVADVAARISTSDDDGLDSDEVVQPASGPPGPVAVPGAPALTDDQRAEQRASVVGVSGIACGRLIEGTGFVADENIVLTNAHVVAGVEEVRIDTLGGGRVPGTVVAFDPATDVAVILVPDLEAPPLPIGATPGRGATGEVLGFEPEAVPEVTPYRVAGEVTATGRDIYGEGDVRRQVLYLAAELDFGDSGAPLVSEAGVAGMVFAVAPGTEPLAFALTADELAELPIEEDGPVSTGECR